MDLTWQDVYERAVELYGGQTPGLALEAQIVERFEAQPAAVVATIDKLGLRFAAGKIHSPWPLVLRELEQQPDRSAIHVSDDSERQYGRAERFIRQVGYICETEQELRAELAERKWPVDERLLALWREVRPIGERLERDADERAEHWKRARAVMSQSRSNDAQGLEPLHTGQTRTPLTNVGSVATLVDDPDADIPW